MKTDHESIEALYFAYRAFTAEPDRILGARQLGRAHHRILYFIGRHPGVSVGDLRDTLGITKQALSGPLKRLLDDALVEQKADAKDKRMRRLHLTANGVRLERELSATQSAMLQRVFDSVGRKQAEAWLATTLALAATETL